MIDYHIHTHHSIDAEGSIDEYCKQALRCGLKEICFTNHCELDPQRDDNLIRFNSNSEPQPFTRDCLLRLRDQVLQSKEHYKRLNLTVKFGLEVGYFNGIEERLPKVTEGIDFDFVLGSIHCLNHICIDSSREYETYYAKHKVPELFHNYFQEIVRLINSELFDSVGHLDVYKKYGIAFYGTEINTLPEDALKNCFRMMVEKEIALEINTAGLRRINEFYPAPAIMKYARAQGIKLISIGSDAHKVEDLGKGIREGIEYAKSFGFDAIYSFEKRKPVRVQI